MNKFEIENFIGVFPNAVPANICDGIVEHYEYLNKVNKIVSRQELESSEQIHKNTDVYFFQNENSPVILDKNANIISHFVNATWGCYNEYAKKYGAVSSLAKHRISDSIKIQKTEPSGGYHIWHCEHGDMMTGRRLMLTMLYLNDVEDGGETEFLYQSKRVKPEKGTLVLCPAGFTHTHRGNPPLQGNKYVINSWIEFIG